MLQTNLKETRYNLFANAASGQYLIHKKKPSREAGMEKPLITDGRAEGWCCARGHDGTQTHTHTTRRQRRLPLFSIPFCF